MVTKSSKLAKLQDTLNAALSQLTDCQKQFDDMTKEIEDLKQFKPVNDYLVKHYTPAGENPEKDTAATPAKRTRKQKTEPADTGEPPADPGAAEPGDGDSEPTDPADTGEPPADPDQ